MVPVFRQALMTALNPHATSSQISRSLSIMKREPRAMEHIMAEGLKRFNAPEEIQPTGMALAQFVDKASKSDFPAYHNKNHFIDAMVGYIRLAESEPSTHFSADSTQANRVKCLGLMATCGHDIGHPGGNNAPGQAEQLEKASTQILLDSGILLPLTTRDRKIITAAIHQTDHMVHMQDAKEKYLLAIAPQYSKNYGDPEVAVVSSVLRQADLFASTSLTPENSLEQGAALKQEFLHAAETNCPHLKGLGFVNSLDTPAAQSFFTKANPCILHSDEGMRIRKENKLNIEEFSKMVEVDHEVTV